MYKKQIQEEKLINAALMSAANQFSGQNAVNSFIQQVLTERERHAIGRRLAIARFILAGATYYEICEKLHISPNTFRNIRRWVSDELPAYNNILNENKIIRQKKDKGQSRKSSERVIPFSFEDLKQRYPMHFFLFNLTDELNTFKEVVADPKKRKDK